MIADIFYPIFTLTITILACFIRKKRKIVQGICTVHQGITLDSIEGKGWGAYSSPWTPSFNRFWLFQEPMHPYFFCIIPWLQKLLTV